MKPSVPTVGLHTRTTLWHDELGNVIRVAVMLIDAEMQDALCEATEDVGPFDALEDAVRIATERAHVLRRRQLEGQLSWLA